MDYVKCKEICGEAYSHVAVHLYPFYVYNKQHKEVCDQIKTDPRYQSFVNKNKIFLARMQTVTSTGAPIPKKKNPKVPRFVRAHPIQKETMIQMLLDQNRFIDCDRLIRYYTRYPTAMGLDLGKDNETNVSECLGTIHRCMRVEKDLFTPDDFLLIGWETNVYLFSKCALIYLYV